MLLKNKTIDNHPHKRKKLKFYAMMLKDTENNARIFLLKKKIQLLQTDADTHNNKRESLSLEDKELFDKKIAAALKKHRKSLTPNQRGQVIKKDAAEHKKKYEMFPPEKKSKTYGNKD